MLAFCHDCNSLQVETHCSGALGGHFEYQLVLLGPFALQGSLLQDPAKQTLNKPVSVLLKSRAVILLLVLLTSLRVLNFTVSRFLLLRLHSAFTALTGSSSFISNQQGIVGLLIPCHQHTPEI